MKNSVFERLTHSFPMKNFLVIFFFKYKRFPFIGKRIRNFRMLETNYQRLR